MSSKPYPLPQSLKDDWRGWVVDQDIRVIEDPINNITFIEARKIPEDYQVYDVNRYAQANTSVIDPPSGINTSGLSKGASVGGGNNYKYSDNVKNIQDSCVAPGTIDSLFGIPEKSCMLSERWSGYKRAWPGGNNKNNHFTSYAGINAGDNGTTPNLTNKLSEIDGTFDTSNIKLQTWGSNISYNPDNYSFTFPSRDTTDQNPPSEIYTYIDVEKKTSDWNTGDDVYWNDYDIWDIKRLYKQNYNDSNDDKRKIWWNNLYNPYCHDMYEWVDTGLRSNESTMRMTCGYKENGIANLDDNIFDKNYVSDEISSNFTHATGDYKKLGNIHYYRGPHEDHPLNSILTNSYQIQNENGEMVNCEDCKNKAAVSWDKEDNGIITGFTGTLEDSTYTESELRDAFSKIIPPDSGNEGMETNRGYYFGNTRDSIPSRADAKDGDYPKLIPEIIGSSKSNWNDSNALSPLREPVVVNITTAQAMRFCNENDDCAGFLHYRLPDNFDYIRNGNSKCEDTPDVIQGMPGYRCYGTPDPSNVLLYRLS